MTQDIHSIPSKKKIPIIILALIEIMPFLVLGVALGITVLVLTPQTWSDIIYYTAITVLGFTIMASFRLLAHIFFHPSMEPEEQISSSIIVLCMILLMLLVLTIVPYIA